MSVTEKVGDKRVPYREILEGLIDRSVKSGKPVAHRAEWEAELYGTPLPTALAYLWTVWSRLRRRIGSNGFGPNPIGLGDLANFIALLRIPLAPWEVEVIEELDDVYLSEQAKSLKPPADPNKS